MNKTETLTTSYMVFYQKFHATTDKICNQL